MGDAEAIILQTVGQVREESKKCGFTVLNHIGDEHLRKKYMAELEEVMVSCAVAEYKVKIARQAARNAKSLDGSEAAETEDVGELFDQCLRSLEDDTDQQEIVNNDSSVKNFRTLLQNEESGDNDNDNEDGDLIVTQQEVNLIDPISMKRMTDPVRNKICGHVYERSSVVNMIKQNRRKGFCCPNVGCENRERLKMDDLEDAMDVKREIVRRKE
ncbi:E3 SUMO-protein ligase NSE2-like [Penaeus chinensis]|uniref:E3 SUMO-protein ligase NSE2-like n=1 Tax=Penaeus chinensis TaxID=139456 RepID=UPI001FB69E43|nr:E3 SUMO-protein ligase NSE2-like [Penaeus chinensis]